MAGNYSLGTATGRILIDGAGAEIGFGVAKRAGQEFFDAISTQLQGLKDFGQSMLKAGAVGAGGFALAGNAAANYEERLSAVKAVSGASADEMAKISEAALKIGSDTSFSATEAASAFEELVKAGISVQDSLDGAALATANLAAAGEIALPRAAEIAANAMNNFNLKGKDMPRIADLVAGAANASAISVEEFAQSLSQVGAVSNLAGISFDDTAVAIAEMGNAGIKGSDAGTSLKTMLMNLQPVTEAQVTKFQELGLSTFSAEKAMKAMAKDGIKPIGSSLMDTRRAISDYLHETEGIKQDTKEMGKAVDGYLMKNGAYQNAFFDTTGKAKGLADIQEELARATKGMTQEQKLASLEVLFGSDAIRAAAIMAKEGKAGFEELAMSMGKVTAADVAATRLDNVKGSIEKLKGSFETLLIQLGMIFLPVVKRVVDGITEFVNWLTTASERARKFFVALGAIGTAGALVVGTLAVLAAAIAPIIGHMLGIMLIKKAFSGVAAAVLFTANAFKTATGPISFYRIMLAGVVGMYHRVTGAALRAAAAATFFGRVAMFAMGPWGKLIQLVLLLAAVGVVLYNTWDPFRELIDGIAAVINGALATAMAFLQTVIDRLVSGFHGMEAAADPLSQLLFAIGQAANAVWQDMQKLGDLFMTNVVPALQELWGILQSAFGDAFAQISAVVVSDLLPALQEMAAVFVNDVFPALVAFGEFLLPIIGFVIQVAGVIIGVLYTALIMFASYLIGTVLPAFLRLAGPVLGFLITAISKVAQFIINFLIVPFINFVTFLFGTVIPAIISFGSMIVGAIGGFFGMIGDAIGAVVGFISGVVASIVGFFSGLGGAAEEGSSGLTGAFAGVAEFFTGIVNAIVGFITGIVNAVVTGFTAVIAFLMPAMQLIGEIIGAVWGVIWAIISGVVGLISALIQFAFGMWVLIVTNTMMGIWNTLVMVWNAILAFIVPILTAIWTFLTAIWTAIYTTIMTVITTIWTFIVTVWTAIWTFITTVLTAIWNIYVSIWTAILTAVVGTVTAIWSFIVSIWNTIMGFLTGVLGAILGVMVSVWTSIVAAVSGPLNAIWSFVSSIWNAIMGFISGVVSSIVNNISTGFQNAVTSAVRIFTGLRAGIMTAWNLVSAFFQSIPGRIQGFFAGASGWLASAGQQIIDGFLSGLRGAAGAITDFFAGITAKIPKIKGPPEHDKVMLIPAGKMIMNSLWKGLDEGKDSVMDLLSDMNDAIPATISTVITPKFDRTQFDSAVLAGMAVNPLNIVNDQGATVMSDTYMVDKLIVNNPLPEPASDSLPNTIRKLSSVGVKR